MYGHFEAREGRAGSPPALGLAYCLKIVAVMMNKNATYPLFRSSAWKWAVVVYIVIVCKPIWATDCGGYLSGNNTLVSLEKSQNFDENGVILLQNFVSREAQATADALIDQLGNQSYEEIVIYGGNKESISIVGSLPEPVKQILQNHLNELVNALSSRFLGKTIEFTHTSIRVNKNGAFERGDLHLDLGGLEEKFTVSTTFNTGGQSTYWVDPKDIVEGAALTDDSVRPGYYDYDDKWHVLPGFSVPKKNLKTVPERSTLVFKRLQMGKGDYTSNLLGKKVQKDNVMWSMALHLGTVAPE